MLSIASRRHLCRCSLGSINKYTQRPKPNHSLKCMPMKLQTRWISSAEVFARTKLTEQILPSLPEAPEPPPPPPSLEELLEAGKSVVTELDLFSWWAPPGYVRYVLEYVHVSLDLPWWVTIVAATTALRLALFYVPVLSKKMQAGMQEHQGAISEFQQRTQNAKLEGDNVRFMRAMKEQREYMSKNNVHMVKVAIVPVAAGSVFMTQFFAIKSMAHADFPGFATGGTLWFHDLTAPDPLFLPLISALTTVAVLRSGVETGGFMSTQSKLVQLCIQLAFPVGIVTANYIFEFPQAVLLYWCTTNAMSLLYAGLFRMRSVKRALGIPDTKTNPKSSPVAAGKGGWWQGIKARTASTPTINDLRRKDAEQFKNAGTRKPAIKVR